MTFQRLQWLFPIAVALHNLEEAISMPPWISSHAGEWPLNRTHAIHHASAEIRIALALLFLAASIVTYLSRRNGAGSVWAYLLFGGAAAMLVNVFVPHIPATIWFRTYTPGVVTAVLINLPVMSLLVVRAVREGWVRGWKAAAFGVGVPITLGAMIAVFIGIGPMV